MFNFSFFSITGWGNLDLDYCDIEWFALETNKDLDYCDIEWFALETNKDHFDVFEIASRYCISDSLVDYVSPVWVGILLLFIAAESEPQNTNTTELQRKDWKPRLLICVLVHAREVTFKSGQCRIRLTH